MNFILFTPFVGKCQDSQPKREPDGFRKLALAFNAFATLKVRDGFVKTSLRCQSQKQDVNPALTFRQGLQ
jgi:hypothetical protein